MKQRVGSHTVAAQKGESHLHLCGVQSEHQLKLRKGEVWESEKRMLDRFGKDEFQIHLNSGRIRWKEDQWSDGVFNYYDQGNVKKKTKVNTGSEWTQGQEYQAEEEDEEKFAKLQGKDLHKHLHDMATLPKGKGSEKEVEKVVVGM